MSAVEGKSLTPLDTFASSLALRARDGLSIGGGRIRVNDPRVGAPHAERRGVASAATTPARRRVACRRPKAAVHLSVEGAARRTRPTGVDNPAVMSAQQPGAPRLSTAEWMARKTKQFEAERQKQTVVLEFKDIAREGTHRYVREAWTFFPQSNLSEDKVLVIERLRYVGSEGRVHFGGGATGGEVEYRFSYFIRRPAGNWVFGQYAPLIPAEDLEPLLAKARSEGTIR